MGIESRYTCDGCGAPCEIDGVRARGYIKKCYYCENCVKSVDDFMVERGNLVEKLNRAFEDEYKKIKECYRGKIRKLPDE